MLLLSGSTLTTGTPLATGFRVDGLTPTFASVAAVETRMKVCFNSVDGHIDQGSTVAAGTHLPTPFAGRRALHAHLVTL